MVHKKITLFRSGQNYGLTFNEGNKKTSCEKLTRQEQAEVDLEKAFAHEYAIYPLPAFVLASIVDGMELIDFIYKTARHFYKLGLNARKK